MIASTTSLTNATAAPCGETGADLEIIDYRNYRLQTACKNAAIRSVPECAFPREITDRCSL
jgi:hypothetical protein